MPTIKTVSVEYGRKVNLGDYNSATVGCTLWADIEEGEDLHQVMHNLWAMVKANVHVQIALLVKDPRKFDPGKGAQEIFLGLPAHPISGLSSLEPLSQDVEQEDFAEEEIGPDVPLAENPPAAPASYLMDAEDAKKVCTPKGTEFGDLSLEQLRQVTAIIESKEASAVTEHDLQMLAAARTLLYEADLPF